MRCVPDVAATADPQLGAQIVVGGQPDQVAGGTSWATPIWTAFCALINQQRANSSQPPLGLLNPKLYPLIGSRVASATSRWETTGGIRRRCRLRPLHGSRRAESSRNLLADRPGARPSRERARAAGQQGRHPRPAGDILCRRRGRRRRSRYQWQRVPSGSSTWGNLSRRRGLQRLAHLDPCRKRHDLRDERRPVPVHRRATRRATPPARPSSLTVNATGVTTMAGWPGSAEVVNGTGWAARFASPAACASTPAGNLFVSDCYSNTIRMVTPAGVVTTVAGLAGMSGSTNGSSDRGRIQRARRRRARCCGRPLRRRRRQLHHPEDLRGDGVDVRPAPPGRTGRTGNLLLRSAEPLRRQRRQHLRCGRHGQRGPQGDAGAAPSPRWPDRGPRARSTRREPWPSSTIRRESRSTPRAMSMWRTSATTRSGR